jgi:excisionase family DNA binding protein
VIANLTLDDLAKRTGMSAKYWERKVSARVIPFTKFGRYIRFTEEQIDQIIAASGEEPKVIPTRDEVSARRQRRAAA